MDPGDKRRFFSSALGWQIVAGSLILIAFPTIYVGVRSAGIFGGTLMYAGFAMIVLGMATASLSSRLIKPSAPSSPSASALSSDSKSSSAPSRARSSAK